MNNSIGVLFPYRRNGVWMFDDAATDLNQEPFVSGVPEMLEYLVASIADAHNGFALYFSAEPFPGSQVKLDWVRPEYGGNWYSLVIDGELRLGWLCPALFSYFQEAPKTIYARAEAVAQQNGRPADSRI